MRILQIHNSHPQHGGEDTVVIEERSLLKKHGHDVELLSDCNSKSPLLGSLQLLQSSWNVSWYRRTRKAIRQFKPDVIHLHNTWFAVSPSVIYAARHERVPIVMTVHNYRVRCVNGLFFRNNSVCTECKTGNPARAIMHRCYKNSVPLSAIGATNVSLHASLGTWKRHVSQFVVLNEFARNELAECGLPSGRMTVQPNFTLDRGVRDSPPSKSNDILFVGMLTEEKGVLDLARAWQQTGKNCSDFRLLLAGDGPCMTQLQAMRLQNTELLGQVNHDVVTNLMKSSRFLVFPSKWFEVQPMTVLEALSVGTPVLVSDIGGLPELVLPHQAGRVFAPGDANSLSQVISETLVDSQLDQLSTNARMAYETEFSEKRKLERLVAAYRQSTSPASNSE